MMRVKKFLLIIFSVCLALCACGAIACGEGDSAGTGDVRVTSVSLDKNQLELEVGESETLTATVLPENATNKLVSWKSSAPAVAQVDYSGKVTAVSAGETTITATADGKSATCTVTVTQKAPDVVHVESVTLNKTSLNLVEGDVSEKLIATVLPENATNKAVSWTSSNNAVATVVDGVVTAVSAGTATITATADGKSAECAVTVTQKASAPVPVESVTLNKTSLNLEVGDISEKLVATVLPENATNKAVSWTSSNSAVATVSDGVVTAVSAGTATITATADGKSAECTVTVTPKYIAVTKVDINRDSATLQVGATVLLEATVIPSNATNKTITWTSSDESVATVSNGTVTAHKKGSAIITATADGISGTCAITVSENVVEVTSITLSESSLNLDVNATATLSATVLPENATDKSVSWRSSDESVATVANGVVKALKAGQTTITATAGEKSAVCTVTVKVPVVAVESVTLNRTALELKVDETFTLVATINPADATENEVIWTSSDTRIATVSDDGTVTAKAVGTVTITASVGGKSAVCEVGVIAKNSGGGGDDPVVPAESIITYAHAGEELASFEWKDTSASGAKAEYKLSSSSIYTSIDRELIRQISASTARADFLGLKGGAKYDFKITSSDGKVQIVKEVEISSLDRSGYAHVGMSGGVGAYKNDGTLKSGAKIIYLTEANKNNIDGNGTSIAEYLSKVNKVTTPIVIRVIGTVGSATWNEITYTIPSGSKKLPADQVKGVNGKQLPEGETSQQELIEGGYNTLNKKPSKLNGAVCEPIKGLNSKATYDSSKKEYDSCWNDCTVNSGKDITIEGVGEDAEIFQWGFTFKSCNSIEVRNLRFYDYTEDACSFEGSENSQTLAGFKHSNFWVHHNTFDIGMNYWDICAEQDKRDGDGATDFKKLSYVTVAYNRYNDTHKTGLVGGGDTHYQACFTFHHNYYNKCDQRMPLGRQANIHIYNNYFYKSGLYSISLRASAYAFIENCVFTRNSASTKPIELVKGDAGTPSAKVIDCTMEGSITNGVGSDYLYQGSDRTKTVEGDNLYGLNFEQKSGFYTVTNKLETSEVAGTIPNIAGRPKRNNNIEIEGGSQEEPPRTPDDVTMSIGNAVADGKMDVGGGQDFDNLPLADGITFTASQTTVSERPQEFEDGKAFSHRVLLGRNSGGNRYFKITTTSPATVNVYVVNASTTDTAGRAIGLYTDKNGGTLVSGTASTNVTAGQAIILPYAVPAGTYYLISTVGDLSLYALDIAENSGGTTDPVDPDPVDPDPAYGQSVSYTLQDADSTVSGKFADGELFTATLSKSTVVKKNFSTATADDGSGKTFDYGLLPSGAGQTVTIVANKAITLKIYYTASDGSFDSKDQLKDGNLSWTVGDTSVSSTKTDPKSNKIAYSETITLEAGQETVISMSASRLVIYGLFAVEK